MLFLTLPDAANGDSGSAGESVSPADLPSKNMFKSIPADYFIENAGQVSNEDVLFYTTSGNMQVGFAESAVLVKLVERPTWHESRSPTNRILSLSIPQETEHTRGILLRIDFEEANRVSPKGVGPLPFPTNYFIGNDPTEWHTNARSYREVVYEGLYEGVNLTYRVTEKGVKYDFIVGPGTDVNSIKITYQGADGIVQAAPGDLLVHTAIGNITDSAPIAYQGGDEVECSFVLHTPNSYGFACNGIDGSRGVVIDPLVYSTYLGGGMDDRGQSIATDPFGNAYVAGYTVSPNFPVTPGAFDMTYNGGPEDAFVAKLDSIGGSLLYSTYLGGGGIDRGYSISTDSAGKAYVTGITESADFPVTPGAFDTTHNIGMDAFVTKLDTTSGSLSYSTYLGGTDFDSGLSVTTDSAGNAYVTGAAWSPDFPVTAGSLDTVLGGYQDGFLAKLDSSGSSLLYSTYLGGGDYDYGKSIAIDSAGDAYVIGDTNSVDFPVTPGAFDTTYNGGTTDSFTAKLDSTGGSLLYATYLGGGALDEGYSIAIDSAGNAYMSGGTWSTDFPVTPGAFDTTHNGWLDVFVAKLNSTNGSLLYSTYIGGSDYDDGYSVATDSTGNVYVAGATYSAGFPITAGAFDTVLNGTSDAFVMKLDAANGSLLYSTYLGGSDEDGAYSIAIDSAGNAYMSGLTWSTDFPVTPGAVDTTYNGDDTFVVMIGRDEFNAAPSASGLGVQGFITPPLILHITDTAPELNWTYSDYEGDSQAQYDLRIGTAPGAADVWDPLAVPGGGTIVTYSGPPLSRGTDYHFAVKVNDSHKWSWEVEVRFHMNSIPSAPTTPITPSQFSVVPANSSQNVSWTSGGDTEGDTVAYEWEVSTDTSFITIIAQGTTTNTTSTSFATNPSTTYFWRVRARDDWEPTTWSDYGNSPLGYWTFITNANGIPVATNLGVGGFTSPPGILHITGSNYPLNWTYSDPDGDPQMQYRVRIRNASGGPDIWDTGPQMGGASYVVFFGILQRGVDYYFGVAVNDSYDWSPFSEVLFRLNSIPNPPAAPVVPSEAAVIAANPTQTVSWTSGGDPDSGDIITFEWQVSADPAFTSVISSGTTTSTTSSSFITSVSTNYYWRVRAHDDWETTTWSAYGNTPPSYWAFSTSSPLNTPPTITITSPSGGEVFYWGGSMLVAWTVWDAEDPETALSVWINYTSGAGSGAVCGPCVGIKSYVWTLWSVSVTDMVINGTVMDTAGLKGYDESGPVTIQSPPNNPPTMTITSPSGGEVWTRGSSHTVTWTASDNDDASSALFVWINYTSGAGSGNVCGPVAGNVGSCDWILPSITASDVVVNGTVIDIGGLKGYDDSGQFSIQAPPPPPNTPPTVTITSPTGGEEWLKGSVSTITWTMHDDQDIDANLTVYINYTTGGVTSPVAAALKGQLSFAWTLPDIEADDIVVNITVIDSGGLKNWSQSGPLMIKAPPPLPPDFLTQYWWLIIVLIAAVIIAFLLFLMKGRKPKGEKEEIPPSAQENPPPSEEQE